MLSHQDKNETLILIFCDMDYNDIYENMLNVLGKLYNLIRKMVPETRPRYYVLAPSDMPIAVSSPTTVSCKRFKRTVWRITVI